MANAIYPEFKDNLLGGNIDFDTGTVKCYLVDLADYTYSAVHALLADLPVAAREEVATLTGVSYSAGLVSANNFTFTAAAGDPSEALVYTIDNGGTERLIVFLDTGVTGLPVTPNGGDIDVNCSAGIVQL